MALTIERFAVIRTKNSLFSGKQGLGDVIRSRLHVVCHVLRELPEEGLSFLRSV